MTRATRAAALGAAILLLLAVTLGGCGGGSPSSTPEPVPAAGSTKKPEAAASMAYVKPADAVCEGLLREAKRIGRSFVKGVFESKDQDLEAAEMDGLIRPGVRSLERVAARFRAIDERHPNPNFAVYVGLYEPLLQLAHLRLAAGDDQAKGRDLEEQMESIGAEQRLAARQAGIKACRINFLHALVASWSNP